MTVPAFDANKHDVNIGGYGFMVAQPIQRADAVPATSRAAGGEGRYDVFQTESYEAFADWEGGVGQARAVAKDAFLCGIGHSQWEGGFSPPWKKQDESNGGTTSHYFNVGGTLYGFDTSTIDQIGSSTTANRTAGTVLCKPDVSGNGSAFWVQAVSNVNKLYRWTGSGAAEDVTPETTVPHLVRRYGKWMWVFGRRTRPAAISVIQSVSAQFGGTDRVSLAWSQTTTPNNLLIAVLWTRRSDDAEARPESANSASGFGATVPNTLGAWSLAGYTEDLTETGGTYIYYYNGTQPRRGVERFEFTQTASQGVVTLIEVAGIQLSPVVDVVVETTGDIDSSAQDKTLTGVSTGTLLSSKAFVLSTFSALDDGFLTNINGFTPGSGWTEVTDLRGQSGSAGSTRHGVFHQIVSSTDAVTHSPQANRSSTGSASMHYSALTIAFIGTPLTVDTEQFTLHVTEDDGATWRELAPVSGTGIGTPLAALATQGYLWFATTSGLYSLSASEREFTNNTDEILVAIRGPLDEWQYPKSTGTAGTRLTTDGESLFYNVGATIRRYPIGGTSASQIWPTESWAIKGGDVQDIVAGEGGLYFGAGGFLWLYNKRGFHCLAAEPAAGAYDTLHWHNGRLYIKANPADYYDAGYPSMRPDIYSTDGTKFDTGYMITSEMDFEKISVLKAIRTFEIHAVFTGGTTAGESGNIALGYYLGCAGKIDPGQAAGGATGLTWTSIGSMSVEDNGVKRITLDTPLYCYRLYVRAVITPGTVGYPILKGIVVNGRALMPRHERVVAPLKIGTGVVDATGAVMYPTQKDVQDAIDALLALRKGTSAFTLEVVGADRTKDTYLVTADAMQDSLDAWRHGGVGAEATVVFSMTELP